MASSVRPKGIRLRTSFVSEEEFVAAFHALCDESSIFIPTDKLHPANTSCYFSLELADEAPMLRGLGVVIGSWSSAANPFEQPGLHVRITQLTTQGEPIFERVLAARPAALHTTGPRTRNAPMTQQQWGSVTSQMEAVVPSEDEEPVPARPITRELRSASLPSATKPAAASSDPASISAAPIAELDERTTGTARYEVHMRLPASAPAPAATRANTAPPARPGTPPPLPRAGTPSPTGPHALDEMAGYPVWGSTPWSVDDGNLDVPPTSWWQVAWWRNGSWRKAWWANRRTGSGFAIGIVVGVLCTVVLRPSRSAEVPALAAVVPAPAAVASCPPPPAAPTVVADASPTAKPAAPPPKVASVAPPPKVASAAPATKVAPVASTAKAAPPLATTTKSVAAVPPVATAPAKSTAKSTPAPSAMATAATAPKPTTPTPKPATTTVAKPTASTTAPAVKAAPAPPKRGKRAPCSSLDCI